MLFATLMKKLALIGPILSKGALLAAVAAIPISYAFYNHYLWCDFRFSRYPITYDG